MHETTRIAEEIVCGNLSVEARERSEQDRLMKALNGMIARLKTMLSETNQLIHTVQEGRLDVRGTAETYEGGWRDLIEGINSLIDAFVEPIMMTAASLEQISQGVLPEKITRKYKGDFNKMKQNFNALIETMQGLQHETNNLIQAVQEGQLDIRGNAKRFAGGWQELVVGMNSVIDAFMEPITMAATMIDRIAKGDIPPLIAEKYYGVFNTIITNLNLLIGTSNEIIRLAEKIANGDLTIEVKERSSHDTLMRTLNDMIIQLNQVVMNVKDVADHVAAGSSDLAVR